ncbi:MAG: RES family NAD+ phosphorylase [Alcanivorax sp.]|nr:RES family NAD+ phosphorylase [Alcanivorax sp.]
MGLKPEDLPLLHCRHQPAWRLVNAKHPPIDIFDDVADQADFDALYAVQTLTNPRLQTLVGQLNLVPESRRPWGIPGCNYALGPFVHLNTDGSRFSAGDFGIFYCAANITTAIAETRYHQQRYFQQVHGLKYDRIVMRGLKTVFSATLRDLYPATRFPAQHDADDYHAARALGDQLRQQDEPGLRYESVRAPGNHCFALLSPHLIEQVTQSAHYEYIWDGERISHVLTIRSL